MNDCLQYAGLAAGIILVSGASVVTADFMAHSAKKILPQVSLGYQSVEIPNSGDARQSRLTSLGEYAGFLYGDVRTVLEAMRRGERISENGPCIGYRGDKPEYKWLTYGEVLERSRNISAGLVSIGIKPGQSSFIGIYSSNRVEWVLTEYACYQQSAVIIALYDTLGPNACSFIINQAEIEIVVCDKEAKVNSLLKHKNGIPSLKHIIVMEEVSDDTKLAAKDKGVELHYFKDIEELGKKNPIKTLEPKPTDLATICYTSGTTGNPKGVMLTHGNMILVVNGFIQQMGKYAGTKEDVVLSILPLAHVYERCVQINLFICGGRLGFSRGDVQLLMEDIQALKPTVLCVVPRLLNKIYEKALANIENNKMKRLLFHLALRSKQSEIERFIVRNNSFWDRLVFKRLQTAFGGRLRILIVGSAPTADHVLTFMRCALGVVIFEGYGQTECTGPCTMTFPGEFTPGHVGPPIPCCHIKLVDVPEMEYFSRNRQGEICIRGTNVFQGYFKDPENTSKAIDADGWLHTGDIGMWLSNGSLKVIDRKKNIFKLAQGEYIVPEKIESIYILSPYVAQIFVHGESLQSCLVAIVVPEKETVRQWCKKAGIRDEWEEICKNKKVKQMILKDLHHLGKTGGLKSFEQVKDIYLHPELFTIDEGLLTPSMKTKRAECKKFFFEFIVNMYRQMI